MDCKIYMLVPKDEFEEVIHKGKHNKSNYKYAFLSMAEEGLLKRETYLYTDNKEYYLFTLDYELDLWDIGFERPTCICELFNQLSKYQILVITNAGKKFPNATYPDDCKGFEYPPLKCPIEKSFKYLEQVKETK